MIPAEHTPIDKDGIAALLGLSASQAARRRPWTGPDFPASLTKGRATHGRPRLWDTDQVAAYAQGHAVPALPTAPQDGDLLDRFEAADYVGVDPTAWERDSYRGRTPPADAHPYGIPHWRRDTLDEHIARRHQPRQPAGGRPAGARDHAPRGRLADQVADLVHAQQRQGETVNIAEIARTLGIHYTTAHRHVSRLN